MIILHNLYNEMTQYLILDNTNMKNTFVISSISKFILKNLFKRWGICEDTFFYAFRKDRKDRY